MTAVVPVNLLDEVSTISDRIELARDIARKIVDGRVETMEEASWVLRWVIANRLGKGIFDPYFDERTFDQLVFEAELYRASEQPRETNISEKINENRDEIAKELFGDWIEEDTGKLATGGMSDSDFMNTVGKDFMNTGDFKPAADKGAKK